MGALITADGLKNIGVAVALLLSVTGAFALLFRRRPSMSGTLFAVSIIAVLVFAIFFRLLPVLGLKSSLAWNWWGKLFSIAACVTFVAIDRNLTWADVGIRRPEPGSIRPALLAIGVVCLSDWALSYLLSDGTSTFPTIEAIAYQASMPGLHEEMFHRAITTVLLERALGPGGGFRLAGAHLSLGALASVVWFGLLHGIGIQNGALGFSLQSILMTGAVGFGLQWIFARTKSLLLPTVAHNLTNLGLILIP